MIATEPDNIESDGVIFLPDEECSSYLRIKYSLWIPVLFLPEHSDLLELDLNEDSSATLPEIVLHRIKKKNTVGAHR
jgi:hypothetical protein